MRVRPPDPLQSLTFSGRTFSTPELQLIQEISRDYAALGRTEISRTLCELLDWKRANGRLKNHECRLLLERLQAWGWLQLPTVRPLGRRGPRGAATPVESEPEPELTGSVGQFEPLCLQVVSPNAQGESQLWRQLIGRYHYLGYRVPFGANLRYLLRSAQSGPRVLACLLWTSPAWKIAVRDRWIGWSEEQRRRNLQLIVNNARFLILPWVRIPHLASKTLSLCARQLPQDWEQRYGYRPLLLETLVESGRFRGTCYRAANWMALGPTSGRGRMDRPIPVPKEVYVYPLCRHVQQRLVSPAAPAFSAPAEPEEPEDLP